MRQLPFLVLVALLFSCRSQDLPGNERFGNGLVLPKSWLKNSDTLYTPLKHRRPPDQTFLTFPEWFLVFSPEEQAAFLREQPAHRFRYQQHLHQLWGSYQIMKDQIRGNYPYNLGYHFMIKVIAISTTLEYGFRSMYEKTIGRFSSKLNRHRLTDEDRFHAAYMQDYVDFIKVRPWYEYNFYGQLPDLWKLDFRDGNPVRKLERRLFLSSELLFKAAYGILITGGTKTAYEEALPNTLCVVENSPDLDSLQYPEFKKIQAIRDGMTLVSLPRYDLFKDYAGEICRKGGKFREIAGNTAAILVSIISPSPKLEIPGCQLVFEQELASFPGNRRFVLAIPVQGLHLVLLECDRQNLKIEHIFDY